MHALSDSAPRRYFLDWLRWLAFMLLIPYHVGMYYVSWDWHIKSPHAGTSIEPLMLLSGPWRLALLFFVAGAALRFVLDKRTVGGVLAGRSRRLLWPLLFGMALIVIPQPYYEVCQKLGWQGGWWNFAKLYWSGYAGFCKDGHCLTLPTWNHLWFVAYLWVYTLLACLLQLCFKPDWQRLAQGMRGWHFLVLPAAWLVLIRLTLYPHFPSTHALWGDWYNHALYFPLFMLGLLVAKQDALWLRSAAWRYATLAAAGAAWLGLICYLAFAPEGANPWLIPQRVMVACGQWCAILAACGWARHALDFDHPLRRYFTEAVFPLYILHQTVIILWAMQLQPLALPPLLEGLLLIILTLLSCLAGYEIIRRVSWLRPLFGLAPLASAQTGRATSLRPQFLKRN